MNISFVFSMSLLMICLWTSAHAQGEYQCRNIGRKGVIVGKGGSVFVSTNGGQYWSTQSVGNPSLTSVEFVTDSVGFSTGVNNTILMSTDCGIHWIRKSPDGVRNYFDITWLNPTTSVFVGSVVTQTNAGVVEKSTILRTTDVGNTWLPAQVEERGPLYSVASGSPSRAVAVGDSGTILLSTNGGASWERVVSGTRNRLYGVDYLDSNIYVAVGTNGTILRSNNQGKSWTEQLSTATEDIHHVAFSITGYGIAVGNKGTILQSLGNAAHWHVIPPTTTENLYAVDRVNDCTFLAVGSHGTMLRSLDSGDSWAALERNTLEDLERVSFAIK